MEQQRLEMTGNQPLYRDRLGKVVGTHLIRCQKKGMTFSDSAAQNYTYKPSSFAISARIIGVDFDFLFSSTENEK